VQAAASYGWQASSTNFDEAMKARRPAGWVERSETDHPFQHDAAAAEVMGFTSFSPS